MPPTSIGWFQHPSAPPIELAAILSMAPSRSPSALPRALRMDCSARRANPILYTTNPTVSAQANFIRSMHTLIPNWSSVSVCESKTSQISHGRNNAQHSRYGINALVDSSQSFAFVDICKDCPCARWLDTCRCLFVTSDFSLSRRIRFWQATARSQKR